MALCVDAVNVVQEAVTNRRHDLVDFLQVRQRLHSTAYKKSFKYSEFSGNLLASSAHRLLVAHEELVGRLVALGALLQLLDDVFVDGDVSHTAVRSQHLLEALAKTFRHLGRAHFLCLYMCTYMC